MAGNAPLTPQAGSPPTTPVAITSQPTSPVNTGGIPATPGSAPTPVQTSVVGQPPVEPVAAPPKPQTLDEVLAARKAALNPNPPVAPPEPAPVAPVALEPPAPVAPPVPTPQEALFQLSQQDPQKLIEILQAANGKPPVDPNAPPTGPQVITPELYTQQQQAFAQQQFAERPSITLEGIFGPEVMAEIGATNQDFTDTFNKFVYATMAPVLADFMSQVYTANHGFHQQLQQVQPMVQQQEMTQMQRDLGRQLQEAFPALGQGDANAKAYAEKRFNELAPMLMTKELMDNPHTNRQEYARITTGIAKIAASEYATVPPAPVPPATTAQPFAPATTPPEPQPVTPTYRNHMGQFQSKEPLTTLEAYNRQRLETLFPST